MPIRVAALQAEGPLLWYNTCHFYFSKGRKVDWLVIPKNQISAILPKPKQDLVHSVVVKCTIAKLPLPTMDTNDCD